MNHHRGAQPDSTRQLHDQPTRFYTPSFTRVHRRTRLPRLVVLLLGAIVLSGLLLPRQGVQAATFNPGCTGGIGDAAALADAMYQAAVNNQSDTINLVGGCTYTVTSTLYFYSDNGNTVTFNGNGATVSGGGAVRVFFLEGGSSATINNVRITNGRGPCCGAGINVFSATLVLNNSLVDNNSTDYGAAVSGGYGARIEINNSVLTGNSAGRGGAIDTSPYTSSLVLNHTTIVGNRSYYNGFGGGISILNRNTVINNSIIANNTGGDCAFSYGGSLTANYSLMGDGSCGVAAGGGNLTGDPGLGGDYEPDAGSAVINAGDPAFASSGTDYRGAARVQAGRVDMGAYETAFTPSVPPSEVSGITVTPFAFNMTETSAPQTYSITVSTEPSQPFTLAVSFDPAQVTLNGSSVSPLLFTISAAGTVSVTVAALENPTSNTDRVTTIAHSISASSAPEYPTSLAVPSVTITIGDVPPPPPTPLCEDHNFADGGVVRVSAPDSLSYAMNCRILYQNGGSTTWLGSALYSEANLGAPGLLELGVQQAIDIFSPGGMTYFNGGAVFCLRGQGTLIWLAASGVPRHPEIIGSYTVPEFSGFTCATLFEPGTLVLVSDNPLD